MWKVNFHLPMESLGRSQIWWVTEVSSTWYVDPGAIVLSQDTSPPNDLIMKTKGSRGISLPRKNFIFLNNDCKYFMSPIIHLSQICFRFLKGEIFISPVSFQTYVCLICSLLKIHLISNIHRFPGSKSKEEHLKEVAVQHL